MKPSDIAKLAAGIAAGTLAYDAVVETLDDDGDVSLLDKLIAGSAGAATGGIVGAAMDATGASGLIDDVADDILGLFD